MAKKKSKEEQEELVHIVNPSNRKEQPELPSPSAEEIELDNAVKRADQKKIQEHLRAQGKAEKEARDARSEMLEALRKKLGLKGIDDLQFANTYEAIPDVISTGHAHLDEAICPNFYAKNGRGGVPLGYLCEFYGPNAGGKSCLGMKMAANVHKTLGSLVLWQDAEGSFQPEWAMSHGVDVSRVILNNQPKYITAEQFLTELEKNVRTGAYRLAVVDSLAGLTPQKILECKLDDNEKIGEKARLMSRCLPRIVAAAKEGNCTVVFINQIRMKIGVMYADPETTPGGESLKFYASLRLRLSQASSKTRGILNQDGEEIGIRSKIVIKKSRFGPPFKEVIVPIYYGEERPHPFDILVDLALSNKIIITKKKKDDLTFLFPPHIIEPMADMDELKAKLTPKMIAAMADKVKEVALLDPDVVDFVKERQVGLEDILAKEE